MGPFAPDTLLASQFFGALKHRTRLDGERRLMIAVLADAVHCFQQHSRSTDPKRRQLFLDAEQWITTTDRARLFSFENLCEALDLDPDHVREGLLAWKDAHAHDDRSTGAARARAKGTATGLRKVS